MSDDIAINQALTRAGVAGDVRALRDLSGGCIHRVCQITLSDGTTLVAKLNDRDHNDVLSGEARSLEVLAGTGTLPVPRPLVHGVFGSRAVLIMTAIPPASSSDAGWRRFGIELAALHAAENGARYGFATDNHLGATPQPNSWCDDWVDFNAKYRLGHQLGLVRDAGLMRGADLDAVQRVIDRLDRILPRHPRPSLIHGDLWSGNVLPTTGERVAVIDPACSIGDGWADIAMMRLFGGFPDACFRSYAAAVDDHERVDERVAVYQLYHVLNHVTLFGRGYATQALALAHRLLA